MDWTRPGVLNARIALHLLAKEWGMVIGFGRQLATRHPEIEAAWISWAYALRELNRVVEARAVLLEAEPRHGKKCGMLHCNLAYYYCLLGEMDEAKKRLRIACMMDGQFKKTALDDPDLKAMWEDIAAMK